LRDIVKNLSLTLFDGNLLTTSYSKKRIWLTFFSDTMYNTSMNRRRIYYRRRRHALCLSRSRKLQGGPEKTAQTLMRYNFSTADHRVTRFPAKCSETNW